MTSFRQSLLAALPVPLRLFLKLLRKTFRDRIDFFYFPLWLVYQCARHRKKAVILFRIGALGDVVCTLPMCGEIRKRHPGKLLVYVTSADYKKMVLLSRVVDQVYGAQSWAFSAPQHFFGLIEKIYVAKVTGDDTNAGVKCHLVDDLAGSCGLIISNSERRSRIFFRRLN